jgi:hypothetical protein
LAERKKAIRRPAQPAKVEAEPDTGGARTQTLVGGIKALVAENLTLRARVAELEGFISTIERALRGPDVTTTTHGGSPGIRRPAGTVGGRPRAGGSEGGSDLLEKRRASMAKARAALAARRAARQGP